MHPQYVIYFAFLAGLVFGMTRVGCGALVPAHGLQYPASNPEHDTATGSAPDIAAWT
jgi:hypothetical protein